jgi:hypothetical protein
MKLRFLAPICAKCHMAIEFNEYGGEKNTVLQAHKQFRQRRKWFLVQGKVEGWTSTMTEKRRLRWNGSIQAQQEADASFSRLRDRIKKKKSPPKRKRKHKRPHFVKRPPEGMKWNRATKIMLGELTELDAHFRSLWIHYGAGLANVQVAASSVQWSEPPDCTSGMSPSNAVEQSGSPPSTVSSNNAETPVDVLTETLSLYPPVTADTVAVAVQVPEEHGPVAVPVQEQEEVAIL